MNTRIKFEVLWNTLSKKYPIEEVRNKDNPNFIIKIPSGAVKVNVGEYGSGYKNGYANIVCVARHFVTKQIYTIKAIDKYGKQYTVKTTADHTCMRCVGAIGNIGFEYEQVSANELEVDDLIGGCANYKDISSSPFDIILKVISIEVDENKDGVWVYDLEVDSDAHVYFANDVLVHNSQFINLSAISKTKCKKHGIDENTRFSEFPEVVKDEVIKEAYHVLDLANANVEQLVNKECHTKHGNILHYSLEYIAAEGMYFKKKHYIVRKILSDDLPCNKFKYSGISVKKAEIPSSMKDFLKKIYEDTMTKNWTEVDFRKEVESAYNKFIQLPWEDISYFKKYRTLKRTLSLTESEKGAGVHARAANFYNKLIEVLGIAGKYPKIGVGDEFRYSYVLPTNIYNMNCIAFKDKFPKELDEIFSPDYEVMFEKIFTKSLENYVKIMNFKTVDPTKQEEDPSFDIF